MHGINLSVVKAVAKWLAADDTVWLVTILKTWGASPRPAGSLFAYNLSKDSVVGSISGGCIEEDLLRELAETSADSSSKISSPEASSPRRKRYGAGAEEQKHLQLPCGGTLELLIEHLEAKAATVEHFKRLDLALSDRRRVMRRVVLSSGIMSDMDPVASPGIEDSGDTLEHTLGPQDRLLIIGASELARYLIPVAISMEFSVTVCDPRPGSMARNLLLEKGYERQACLPDDLVRERFNDKYCAIVALAHDPRVDDLALIAALDTPAFFVGAMGSSKTSENRFNRLKTLGLSAEQLARLHAPIGLPIGSKTPPEIAISIAAQLVEQRGLRER